MTINSPIPEINAQRDTLILPLPDNIGETSLCAYEERMFLLCRIPGLLPVRRGFRRSSPLYLFRIGTLIPLSGLLASQTDPAAQPFPYAAPVPALFLELLTLRRRLKSYLLSPDHLYCPPDCVFFSEKEGFSFLFLPFFRQEFRLTFAALLSSVMPYMPDDDRQLLETLTDIRIMAELADPDWSGIERLLLALSCDRENPDAGRTGTDTEDRTRAYAADVLPDDAPTADIPGRRLSHNSLKQERLFPMTRRKPDTAYFLTALFFAALVLAVYAVLHSGILRELPTFFTLALPPVSPISCLTAAVSVFGSLADDENEAEGSSGCARLIPLNPSHQTFLLTEPSAVLGRRAGSVDYRLPSEGVNRIHALIDCRRGDYYLSDPGSLNGTYLNGQVLPDEQAVLLRDGDEIYFADVGYTFRKE